MVSPQIEYCTEMSTIQSNDNVPENHIEASVKKIICLTSYLNMWSSKLVVTHGDKFIDVSSAAQGVLASPPSGIFPSQTIDYYGTKYCFDDNLFPMY